MHSKEGPEDAARQVGLDLVQRGIFEQAGHAVKSGFRAESVSVVDNDIDVTFASRNRFENCTELSGIVQICLIGRKSVFAKLVPYGIAKTSESIEDTYCDDTRTVGKQCPRHCASQETGGTGHEHGFPPHIE